MSVRVDVKTCSSAAVVRAQQLYAGYVDNAGGLSHTGSPCPPWERLPHHIQSNWCAVALLADALGRI